MERICDSILWPRRVVAATAECDAEMTSAAAESEPPTEQQVCDLARERTDAFARWIDTGMAE
jgi:hypothetical protein